MNDFLKSITSKLNKLTSKGTKVTASNAPIVYCTKCGKTNQKTSNFCAYCGAKLFFPEESKPVNTTPAKPKITPKIPITPEELDYQTALRRYLTTRHISAPSKFD